MSTALAVVPVLLTRKYKRNKMSLIERAVAMVNCRMISHDTWVNAVNQFLLNPITRDATRMELMAMESRNHQWIFGVQTTWLK